MNTSNRTEVSAVKRSDILLAAWMAAEEALPADALALIKKHDLLFAAWGDDAYPSPIPEELVEASKRVEADPLASIAFSLRRQSNQAAAQESSSRSEPTEGCCEKAQEAQKEAA